MAWEKRFFQAGVFYQNQIPAMLPEKPKIRKQAGEKTVSRLPLFPDEFI